MRAGRGAPVLRARARGRSPRLSSSTRPGPRAVCANCQNGDPAKWLTDYKNGNYVCMACGAIDFNRVLSTEEESRVFADDTAADKEQKKRAEHRADGGLGSYIAGGVERRGQLPNPAIQSLQRAQLRLQDAPAELIAAAEAGGAPSGATAPPRKPQLGTSKLLDRYKSEIDRLGEKVRIGDSVRQMARMLADRWAAQLDEHERRCRDDKCHMRSKGRRTVRAEAAAGAFLQSASKRAADGEGGEGAARALQEFEMHTEQGSHKAMRSFYAGLNAVFAWDKRVGCAAGAGAELAAPAGAGGSVGASTAKGLVSRAVGKLCAERRAAAVQIEQHAFGLLDWISAESLLLGRQPRTVAAAALLLSCNELLRAGAPAMGDVELPSLAVVAAELATMPATVQAAIDAVKRQREAAVASAGGGGAVQEAPR